MTSQLFKIQSVVLFLFVLIGFCPVDAKITKFSQGKLSQAAIDAILKRYKVEPSNVSIEILNDDKSVYALNENTQKIPASISKILTSYAVLKK
ncbi:MAG: hypothetical protein K2P92_00170, partial [Bdellovibrionaceae bacterium]|nr:hypothetical protein [Pseudobdellovibrionaceae bacterium]